jgi:hypothetical protein
MRAETFLLSACPKLEVLIQRNEYPACGNGCGSVEEGVYAGRASASRVSDSRESLIVREAISLVLFCDNLLRVLLDGQAKASGQPCLALRDAHRARGAAIAGAAGTRHWRYSPAFRHLASIGLAIAGTVSPDVGKRRRIS